jgi:hypothetical protein
MLEQGRADRTEHHAFDTAAPPGADDKQLSLARSVKQRGASAALADLPSHGHLRVSFFPPADQILETVFDLAGAAQVPGGVGQGAHG